MMRTAEAPILLLYDKADNVQQVNYRVKGTTYIVDKLFDKAMLGDGTDKSQSKVVITRGAQPKKGWNQEDSSRSGGNCCSAVVRRDFIPEPAVTVRVLFMGVAISFVTRGARHFLTEDRVNYVLRRPVGPGHPGPHLVTKVTFSRGSPFTSL